MFNLVLSNSIKKNKTVAYRAITIVVLTVLGIGWGQAECSTQNDVIKGMRIDDFHVVNDSMYLQTTGAIFEIKTNAGKIEIYQRIGKKRKLAEVSVSETFLSVLKTVPLEKGFEYVWFGEKDKAQEL